mmetsp:Transcript_42670/g.74950  ORF Transcript_42670/g.74950 Transcript_42670/m.74950 type:complete len:342 (+) Transcript_42670:77-1102(+)
MRTVAFALTCLACAGHRLRILTAERQDPQKLGDAVSEREGVLYGELLQSARSSSDLQQLEPSRHDEVSKPLKALTALLRTPQPVAGWQLTVPSAGSRMRHQLVRPRRSLPARHRAAVMYPGMAKKLTGGFVDEMRMVAMKMHTREQAPKEGKKEATEVQQKPVKQWQPTAEGYLKFLVESKVVYDCMEALMAEAPEDSPYHAFKDTGLERGSRLEEDIAWLAQEKGLEVPAADGAGAEYAKTLEELAKTDTPAFICHFYNQYFAHSAGGRQIGKKVSDMVLDGKKLHFYMWDDLESSMSSTKAKLNAAAEKWTSEEKEHCLEETAKSFKLSGDLLKYIASS